MGRHEENASGRLLCCVHSMCLAGVLFSFCPSHPDPPCVALKWEGGGGKLTNPSRSALLHRGPTLPSGEKRCTERIPSSPPLPRTQVHQMRQRFLQRGCTRREQEKRKKTEAKWPSRTRLAELFSEKQTRGFRPRSPANKRRTKGWHPKKQGGKTRRLTDPRKRRVGCCRSSNK